MKHSKQILSITSAAVDALSNTRDVHKEKRAELQQAASSIPREDIMQPVSLRHQNPPSPSSSTSEDRVSDCVNGGLKDQTSSSPFELSFNGTQRVRVPSRLLREIKSPLERSSSSSDSKETPGVISIVEDQMRPTPVKVVRHINHGPSAWIVSNVENPVCDVKHPDPVKTLAEPPRDDTASGTTLYKTKESGLAGKQVTEVTMQHVDDETHGQETYGRRKDMPVKGLYQGQPKCGAPVFNLRQENAGDVKVKRFVLNDKEKALKEQFLKRQDQKRPVKKLVQPTVVPPLTDEGSTMQGGTDSDNPVATAAAIAAAAASAATGPFLQLQHSLEAQIAALVSNLQVIQQNHNKQQELQDKERESKLQQQIEERLKRLEDLQANMLETQPVQSAPVSFPTATQQPLVTTHPSNTMDPAGMVLPGHMTAATFHPVPAVSSYHRAPGTAWRDDMTQPQYTVAGHYTTHESQHDPEHPISYPASIPAFEKHKVTRNTRTQTSPQESISSEESPLQTPLPRKRPPIPISRYDLPRSRGKGPRSDADRRAEKKARVRFESDVSPRLPPYMKEMTHKGRGLVKELVSQDPTFRGDETGMESRKQPDSIPVLPLRSETATLSNDVGKIKTELRDILSETERLKQELVQHQLAKDVVHSHTLPIRPTGPSPLDEYLETTRVSQPSRNPATSRQSGFLPTNSTHHHADAERILQDVQRRRQNLDSNLEAVIRKREEQDLYNLVDNIPTTNSEFDDLLRIRREVDKKIGEITSTVQREINQETKDISQQKEDFPPLKKSQAVKATLYGARRVEPRVAARPGLVTGKKAVNKTTGKENLPEKVAAKKGKSTRTQAPPKHPPAVTPAQKQVYLSSVYGRQPYHPQRTTSKAPYLHYQSPVNPKTAAIMAGIMAGESRATGKPVLQDLTSVPEKDVTLPRKKPVDAVKHELSPHGQPTKRKDSTQYFFHPRVDLSQVAPGEGMSRVSVPLEGQLVPMAIPLGKPKTDPALRPPIATEDVKHTSQMQAKAESPSSNSTISTDTSESRTPDPTPVRPSRPTRLNVAVITVYDKELGESTTHQHKRQKKSPAKKKQSSLSVQVLPKVDIDSFSESASSSPSLPHVSDIPEPLSRPDDSEYQEFRNFLAVTETGTEERVEEQALDDADDDFHRIPTPQHPLTLEGFTGVQDQPYNGPPFPPVHPPVSVQQTGGVLEADSRQEEALQERAMEWIEQELLARIVSEMNQPVPDPTTQIRPQATPESSTVSEPEDEDADMLAATIGLGGIQLFIDAGLPVDRDLVTNLIREVIAENVSTILGHPKPRASSPPSRQPVLQESGSPTPSPRGTPLPTPTPTPEYTPPESEESAHESAILATPERTPTPSVVSEEATPSDTREEDKAFEPISEGLDKEEQTSEQISEARTPVSTPVPTPPGAQSPPVSISTPEPSVREPELSQDTVVPTPPPSVVVKTPTPEPEPEPELSIAGEPSQPTEPSVSQKELTPPKPAKPSVSSPSSMSSTTLGTTTITTEEEMSEGEMIQPFVHAGMYSEGEFAVSPTIVQLAAQRKLPVSGDWDTTMLGQDEDSRNELVRVALNGILQRGGEGKRIQQVYRDSSSSVSESMYQVSSASTLRDTEEIREDSITDVTHSEGEVLVKDPMAVLLSRIQTHMRSAENSMASEGELLTEHLRMPDQSQEKHEKRDGGEIAPGNISPGEVVWEPTSIRRDPIPVPTEVTLDDVDVEKETIPATIIHEVAPTTADGEPSHDDRSLHASDLLPGTLGTDIASPAFAQQRSKPRVIHIEERESEPSGSHSQKTYSLDERRREYSGPRDDKQVPAGFSGLDLASKRNDVAEAEAEEMEPQQATKIQVTLPSIDDADEESSLASEHPVSIEQDTFGDVSSISGGDF